MITYNELLHGHVINDLSIKQQQNLEEVLKRINMVRTAWNKPMTITSGFRSEQEHRRIYAAKNITGDKVPMGSAHLQGLAVDIADADGKLKEWLTTGAGASVLIDAGLYCESGTAGWVHFQYRIPRSGHRWFMP